MKALAWDQRPDGLLKPLATALGEYGIDVQFTYSLDELDLRLRTESCDFILGSTCEPTIVEFSELAKLHPELPTFLLTTSVEEAAGNLLQKSNILVLSVLMPPSWSAGEILRHLHDQGLYVDNKRVFLVYGRDLDTKQEVEGRLQECGLEVAEFHHNYELSMDVLNEMDSCGAVVAVCTPDDARGTGLRQPRQNVLFELGIALGLSRGWRRTIVLQRWGDTPDEQAVLPSDLSGMLALRFNRSVDEVLPHLMEQLLAVLPVRPELLLQATLVEQSSRTDEGVLIRSVALPWLQIYRQIGRDPHFLMQFVGHPRKFEEFIAGVYCQAGFEVTLTPRSGDGGRDVIASRPGFGAIRFLEQIKAYKPGHLVTHDDVRAILGVLSADLNASKCLITTTSDFQPTVTTCDQFKPFIPNRLELKNGKQTLEWLKSINPNLPSML